MMPQFIDLNQSIGGFDDNGALSPGRAVANKDGLDIAYRTGRLNQGVTTVPIVDVRNYVDDDGPNVHQYVNTYRTRARLDRFYGTHANQVMFRAKGGQSTSQMNLTALDTLGTWLDNLKADRSNAPLAQKVISSKPADAVDACWIGGVRTNGVAQIGADNICETTYAPHSLPQNVAGRPLDSIVSKCQMKPVSAGDYPGATSGQVSPDPGDLRRGSLRLVEDRHRRAEDHRTQPDLRTGPAGDLEEPPAQPANKPQPGEPQPPGRAGEAHRETEALPRRHLAARHLRAAR